ncbi:hypothetical protein ABEB36_011716 [Hypothenemus hampei]|uniref:Chaperone DnaJ C-terminal domain-containing protein n=1 Tax=Hypothenemus hampei TaxID=57062 RepID=A0ABD1E8S0_HYPHA
MKVYYYKVLQIPRANMDLEMKKSVIFSYCLAIHRTYALHHRYRNLAIFSNPRSVIRNSYGLFVARLLRSVRQKRGVPGPDGYTPAYHYHNDPMLTYKYGFLLDEIKNMKIHVLVFNNAGQDNTDICEKILTTPLSQEFKTELKYHFQMMKIKIPLIFELTQFNILILTTRLTLEEALIDTVITVYTTDHTIIRIPITDVVNPTYEKIIRNKGLPILDKYLAKGNLILRFKINLLLYVFDRASKNVLKKGFFGVQNWKQRP